MRLILIGTVSVLLMPIASRALTIPPCAAVGNSKTKTYVVMPPGGYFTFPSGSVFSCFATEQAAKASGYAKLSK